MRRITFSIKTILKRVYGLIYIKLLPILVHPPYQSYKGSLYSLHRTSIIRFLESWQDDIHGNVLDVGVGTFGYPRSLFEDKCAYTATDCFKHPNIDTVSDIHFLTDMFAQNYYDFVICTDVLEHISQPWKAVCQLYAVLKPGGTLLLTMPFNFHLHETKTVGDYWRISADGINQLLINIAGFHHVNISAIGNPEFPFGYTVVARK